MSVHHHKLPIVTDGLIFQVDAANGLGGNVTDTKNLVTPTESGTFVSGGVVNDEFDFDGVDDYVGFGNVYNDLLTDSGGNAKFTATVQIKIPLGSPTIGNPIIAKWGVSTRGVVLGYRSDLNYFYIQSSTNGLDNNGWKTTNPFLAGNTYSITFIVDNNLTFATGARRIFINGVEEAVISAFGTPTVLGINSSTVADFNIAQFDGGGSYFYGQMSSSKIYDRTLTAAEITQNYEATKHKFE